MENNDSERFQFIATYSSTSSGLISFYYFTAGDTSSLATIGIQGVNALDNTHSSLLNIADQLHDLAAILLCGPC
jgi:hypothetical protein